MKMTTIPKLKKKNLLKSKFTVKFHCTSFHRMAYVHEAPSWILWNRYLSKHMNTWKNESIMNPVKWNAHDGDDWW